MTWVLILWVYVFKNDQKAIITVKYILNARLHTNFENHLYKIMETKSCVYPNNDKVKPYDQPRQNWKLLGI